MKPRSSIVCSIVLLALSLVLLHLHAGAAPGPGAGSETLPPGVKVETVLQGMKVPVAMAFDPSGRLFYTEKTGSVRLFANGVLQDKPVITYNVSTCSERGLLGIAVDPNFVSNHYIYVYYTQGQGPGCDDTRNKVVRFVEHDGIGSDSVDIFTSPQTAGNHNGGSIHFGPDGKLYISIGDSANAANSQDLTVPNGKIHRINPDGLMPTDNPQFNQQGTLPSIYAYGLRNSFDFTFDSIVSQRIFASENGPDCDDEMNRIEAGLNYGWRAAYPCDDEAQGGADPKYNSIQPLWFLPRGACCQAPTGIIVYTGNQIPQWKNQVFMASYNNALLYHFTLNGDRTSVADAKVLEGIKLGMALANGPDGALYFIQGGGYADGTLMRFTGPRAPATATPPVAQPPATVPGSGSRTFPETGRTVSGIFLDYWNGHGGLPQQGFPISGLLQEVSDLNGKTYTVQYFERAVFEYHPENQPAYNVLLSQLGAFRYKDTYPNGAPNQQPDNSAGSVLFPQTGKRLGGRFLRYWQQNGGVMQQGYPISDEFTETSDLDGKPYLVQYFERSVFEYHPENKPPYDVLLSQLGTFRYKQKYGGK